MKEIWKEIPTFEGCYQASSLGQIKSFKQNTTKGQILKPNPNIYGYYSVTLYGKDRKYNKFVHNLVLETFVGPRPQNYEGCHNDGDPSNNKLINLRWDTRSNNQRDRIKHGTYQYGEKNATSKLKESDVIKIITLLKQGVPRKQISELYKVTPENISTIASGKTWKELTGFNESKNLRKNKYLSKEQKTIIKKEFLQTQTTYQELADKYGISKYTVRDIVKNDKI